MYHYTESGLDYIWLRNGYTEEETPWGPGVAIDNVEGLHKVIALALARKEARLTGAEFRFLRRELDLSQRQIAAMWKVSEQTIANYEKGARPIPVTSEAVLRALYLEAENGNSEVTKQLQAMVELDNEIADLERRIELMEREDKSWVAEAA